MASDSPSYDVVNSGSTIAQLGTQLVTQARSVQPSIAESARSADRSYTLASEALQLCQTADSFTEDSLHMADLAKKAHHESLYIKGMFGDIRLNIFEVSHLLFCSHFDLEGVHNEIDFDGDGHACGRNRKETRPKACYCTTK